MSAFKKYFRARMIPGLLGFVIFLLGGVWGAFDSSIGIGWGLIFGAVAGTFIGKFIGDELTRWGLTGPMAFLKDIAQQIEAEIDKREDK